MYCADELKNYYFLDCPFRSAFFALSLFHIFSVDKRQGGVTCSRLGQHSGEEPTLQDRVRLVPSMKHFSWSVGEMSYMHGGTYSSPIYDKQY